MSQGSPRHVTGLLRAWSRGDERAGDELIPLVYGELRRRAARELRRERGATLRTTGLVHEAYLRLVGQRGASWQSRGQFFLVAAEAMRRVLVDHARARRAAKRAPGGCRVTLGEDVAVAAPLDLDVLALDRALVELGSFDPGKARVVELRFFGGLGLEETAEAMGVSPSTVTRQWRLARAWLFRRLSGGEAEPAGERGADGAAPPRRRPTP
jgi:RNA polymerase sigma factor (TIGR02999 family)